jgi:hypothetical protein
VALTVVSREDHRPVKDDQLIGTLDERRLTGMGMPESTSHDCDRVVSFREDGERTSSRWCLRPPERLAVVNASSRDCSMERTGIEPVTSGLQSRRSPS